MGVMTIERISIVWAGSSLGTSIFLFWRNTDKIISGRTTDAQRLDLEMESIVNY